MELIAIFFILLVCMALLGMGTLLWKKPLKKGCATSRDCRCGNKGVKTNGPKSCPADDTAPGSPGRS